MRRKGTLILCMLLALWMLTSCTSQAGGDMTISQATLSEEEEGILSLLGSSKSVIFDFTINDRIRSLRVERYVLDENGAWEAFGGGSFAISGEKGRIALSFDPNGDEIRFAVQDEHGTSAIRHGYPDAASGFIGMSVATSIAENQNKIVPDQEIPLAVQIIPASSKTVSYSTEYFFHPEEYQKHGYEYVYAITVTFSENNLP